MERIGLEPMDVQYLYTGMKMHVHDLNSIECSMYGL